MEALTEELSTPQHEVMEDVVVEKEEEEDDEDEDQPPSPEGGVAGDGAEDEPQMEFDFGKKKKKKDKVTKTAAVPAEIIIDGTGNPFVRGPTYPYEELLTRMHDNLAENNPDLQGTKRYTIRPPTTARMGSKKVAWTNFKEICQIMNRNPDHVVAFVAAELATSGSIAGDGQLILKGRFGPKHFESLLRKYITEYVTCNMCRSANTELHRDNRTRLYHIDCKACGANRSVTTIKTGFHAVSRADRRKAKQAK